MLTNVPPAAMCGNTMQCGPPASVSVRKLYGRPGQFCPECGRTHRTWSTLLHCWYPSAEWIDCMGVLPTAGPVYVVLAHCGGLTVTVWRDLERAAAAKSGIDRLACGGRCRKAHELIMIEAA